MKRMVKKILTFVLAISLSITPYYVIPNSVKADEDSIDSLVCNGGFESGNLNDWTIIGGKNENFTIDNQSYAGNKALKVTGTEEEHYYCVRNTVYSVLPNTEYILSYQVNVESLKENGGVYFSLYEFEHTWKEGMISSVEGQSLITETTGGYKQVSYEFKTSSKTDILQIDLGANEVGTVYFDNVIIVPKSEDIMINGDFSSDDGNVDLTGWSADGPLEEAVIKYPKDRVTAYACDFENAESFIDAELQEYDGNHYMTYQLENVDKYTGVTFDTVPGKTYTVKYKILVGEMSGEASVGLGFQEHNGANDYELKNIQYQTEATENWVEVSVDYYATKTNVDLYVQCWNGGATIALDDIQVYYETPKTETKETKVASFDFEGEQYEIGSPNGAQYDLSSDVVHNGNKSLKVTYTSPWQTIETPSYNLEKGKTYQLSYWVNIAEAKEEENIFCYSFALEGSSGKNISFEQYAMKELSQGWQKVEIAYTPQEDTAIFEFSLGGTTGVVYYDNIEIKLVETKELEPIITEGVGAFGYDGGHALMVNSKSDVYNYATAINLVQGKRYTYSFWVKTTNTEDGFEFIPYVDNCKGGFIPLEGSLNGDHDWVQFTGTFCAPEKSETEGIRIGFYRQGVGSVYIDDFSISNEQVTNVHIHQGKWTVIEPVGSKPGKNTLTCTLCEKIIYEEMIPADVQETTKDVPKETTKDIPKETTKKEETTKKVIRVGKISVKKAQKAKKSAKIKISLKAIKNIKGYEVVIAKDKKCKKVLIRKSIKKSNISITNKRLKKRNSLYVKARAYIYDGKKKKYGNWSSVKKVMITKK